jgi:hypothetical protein
MDNELVIHSGMESDCSIYAGKRSCATAWIFDSFVSST